MNNCFSVSAKPNTRERVNYSSCASQSDGFSKLEDVKNRAGINVAIPKTSILTPRKYNENDILELSANAKRILEENKKKRTQEEADAKKQEKANKKQKVKKEKINVCDNREVALEKFVEVQKSKYSKDFLCLARFVDRFEQNSGQSFLNYVAQIVSDDFYRAGQGASNRVFNIPDSENYVLRVKRDNYEHGNFDNFFKNVSEMDWNNTHLEEFAIELDRNLGQKIALIKKPATETSDEIKIQVLLKQKGKSIGVNMEFSGILNNNRIFKDTIRQLGALSQSAYDSLIDDLNYAFSKFHIFDANNPNNFMVDETNKKINIVDLNPIKQKHMHEFPSVEYGLILYSLLSCAYHETFFNSDVDEATKKEMKEKIQIIIEKYMQAMKNNNSKFSYDDFIYLCTYTTPVFDEYFKVPHLKTADYDQNKWNALLNKGLVDEVLID